MPRAARVRLDEISLHYFDWGGDGPPLVLLHGAGGNGRWWDATARTLKPYYRVYAPDMRGHGDSDKPPSGYSTLEVAEDILAFVNALGLETPYLVGHSYAGKALVSYAATHPRQTACLVLVDPSPAEAAQVPPDVAEAMLAPLMAELGPFPSLDAALAAVRQLPQYRGWDTDLERAFRYGLTLAADGTLVGKMPPWVVRQAAQGVMAADVADLLPRIAARTLLVTFSETEQLVGHGARLSGALPDCTWVTLEGNHWGHVHNRPAFHRVIGEFLIGQ